MNVRSGHYGDAAVTRALKSFPLFLVAVLALPLSSFVSCGSGTSHGDSDVDTDTDTGTGAGEFDLKVDYAGQEGDIRSGVLVRATDAECKPTDKMALRLSSADIDCKTNFCIGFPAGLYVKVELRDVSEGNYDPISILVANYVGGSGDGIMGSGKLVLTQVDRGRITGTLDFSGDLDGKAVNAKGSFTVPVCE
ncbi:MAG: hypothetical protein GXP49_09985 [Deltaproteobacteria bacterium]|nr:hypothetical protein [Deltaproteobacteria bacterium]